MLVEKSHIEQKAVNIKLIFNKNGGRAVKKDSQMMGVEPAAGGEGILY